MIPYVFCFAGRTRRGQGNACSPAVISLLLLLVFKPGRGVFAGAVLRFLPLFLLFVWNRHAA